VFNRSGIINIIGGQSNGVNKIIKKCEIPKTVCNLRDKDGYCSLGYECRPVIDKCLDGEEGVSCERIENGYCQVYIFPETKWRANKTCPMATHLKKKEISRKEQNKIRVGQQKQSKRR